MSVDIYGPSIVLGGGRFSNAPLLLLTCFADYLNAVLCLTFIFISYIILCLNT